MKILIKFYGWITFRPKRNDEILGAKRKNPDPGFGLIGITDHGIWGCPVGGILSIECPSIFEYERLQQNQSRNLVAKSVGYKIIFGYIMTNPSDLISNTPHLS